MVANCPRDRQEGIPRGDGGDDCADGSMKTSAETIKTVLKIREKAHTMD